jgi:hypothetical protein
MLTYECRYVATIRSRIMIFCQMLCDSPAVSSSISSTPASVGESLNSSTSSAAPLLILGHQKTRGDHS